MCRMCSFYNRIDLKQLPTSNPFLDEDASPADIPVPNDIIIESPESQRHTAWTNMRRFPSLYLSAPAKNENSLSSSTLPKPISIFGPQELTRQSQSPYQSYLHGTKSEVQNIPRKDARAQPHKLVHQSRVNSVPLRIHTRVECDDSSTGSTSGQPSPISDDEFAYLPSSRYTITPPQTNSYSAVETAKEVLSVDVPIPAPLKVRRAPQSPTEWMNEACRNL